MKNTKETNNEYEVFQFLNGKTLPLDKEVINHIENSSNLLLLGNVDGLFSDTYNGVPSLIPTGHNYDKTLTTVAFYKRFSNPKLYTQFVIHSSQKEYYVKLFENFAINEGIPITIRERNNTTYKVVFVPNVNIGLEEYNADMEALKKIEVHSVEQRDAIHKLMAKYSLVNLIYENGKITDAFPQNVMITTFNDPKDLAKTIKKTKIDKKTGEKIVVETTAFDKIAKDFHTRIGGTKDLNYDCIIMNPPYDGSLHLKIVEKAIELLKDDNSICVNLSPCGWLFDKMATHKSGYYKSFKNTVVDHIATEPPVIKAIDAAKMFGAGFSLDLGIYTFVKRKTGYVPTKNDIVEKVILFGHNLKERTEENVSDGWRVRLVDVRPLATNHNDINTPINRTRLQYTTHDRLSWVYKDGKTKDGTDWTQNIVSKSGHEHKVGTKIPLSIPFPNEIEAVNFENCTRTIFYRYLHLVMKNSSSAEPLGFLPWLGDVEDGYKAEWTNEDLCRVFNITGFISDTEAEPSSEWETILETMKPYL